MNSQVLLSLALSAGCEVTEYTDHYCIKRTVDVNIVVTMPKMVFLVKSLVDKIIKALRL